MQVLIFIGRSKFSQYFIHMNSCDAVRILPSSLAKGPMLSSQSRTCFRALQLPKKGIGSFLSGGAPTNLANKEETNLANKEENPAKCFVLSLPSLQLFHLESAQHGCVHAAHSEDSAEEEQMCIRINQWEPAAPKRGREGKQACPRLLQFPTHLLWCC